MANTRRKDPKLLSLRVLIHANKKEKIHVPLVAHEAGLGSSFKVRKYRKPIGDVSCCDARMAKHIDGPKGG